MLYNREAYNITRIYLNIIFDINKGITEVFKDCNEFHIKLFNAI